MVRVGLVSGGGKKGRSDVNSPHSPEGMNLDSVACPSRTGRMGKGLGKGGTMLVTLLLSGFLSP